MATETQPLPTQELPQGVIDAQAQVEHICHPKFAAELSGRLKPVEPTTLNVKAVRKGVDGWALLNGLGKGLLVYDVVKDNVAQLGLGEITADTAPQQKLEMISALFKQLEEKGFDPLVGKTIMLQTADGSNFPYVPDAGQLATVLQVYAIDLGQQIADDLIEQLVATPSVTETKEEITYKTHRIKRVTGGGKIALTVGHSEDYKGTNLSEEQGSFWKVDRAVALETAGGTTVNYQTLSGEVNKSVGENKYGVFTRLQERFAPAVNTHAVDIAPRVLRLINQRLEEKDLDDAARTSLQQLIKGGENYLYDDNREVNTDRLNDALSILFPFKSNYGALVAEKGADAPAKQKRLDLKRKIQADFGEWCGVMFGREGLQRTVAVDLRIGMAIEDVMVPDEITAATLEMKALVKKSRSLEGKETGESEGMAEILQKLQDRIDTRETDQQNLRDLHLMRQKAMLKAFNVKVGEKDVVTAEDEAAYVDLMGRLGATAEKSPAVKSLIEKYSTLESLAQAISQKYEGLQSKPILEENTGLTLRLIEKNGVNLTDEQTLAIKNYLSAETFLAYKKLSAEDRLKQNKLTPGEELQRKLWLKTESEAKPAAELTEDDWNLPKTKRNEIWAIIRSGDRVLSAVAQLGMDQAEFASQIDQWRMGGDILRMALKGIKARADMGKFEKGEVVEHTTHRTKTVEVPGTASEKPTVEFPKEVIHYAAVQQSEGLSVVNDDGVVEDEETEVTVKPDVDYTNSKYPAEGRVENLKPDLDAVPTVVQPVEGVNLAPEISGNVRDQLNEEESFETHEAVETMPKVEEVKVVIKSSEDLEADAQKTVLAQLVEKVQVVEALEAGAVDKFVAWADSVQIPILGPTARLWAAETEATIVTLGDETKPVTDRLKEAAQNVARAFLEQVKSVPDVLSFLATVVGGPEVAASAETIKKVVAQVTEEGSESGLVDRIIGSLKHGLAQVPADADYKPVADTVGGIVDLVAGNDSLKAYVATVVAENETWKKVKATLAAAGENSLTLIPTMRDEFPTQFQTGQATESSVTPPKTETLVPLVKKKISLM